MKNFSVPDICDIFPNVAIADFSLSSYGGNEKFYGQIQTAQCEHSNSVVKEFVEEDGTNKVLFINHTGSDLCSMVGDQIVGKANENNWNGIIVNGYIRDVEVIRNIPIGVYAKGTYPMKTDKSIGLGHKNISMHIAKLDINPNAWVYIDLNGMVISQEKLEL